MLLSLPGEIILQILGYLDLPDQANLSTLSPYTQSLAADPALHRVRLLVVAPSRVSHDLTRIDRPIFGELVARGFARGLQLARRWRQGNYLYSAQSIQQYEVYRAHRLASIRTKLSRYFASGRRPKSPKLPPLNAPQSESDRNPLLALHTLRILPDVEESSFQISRALLPTVLKLKHSIRRDEMKKILSRASSIHPMQEAVPLESTVTRSRAQWFVDGKGRRVCEEDERIRLIICPGVRQVVRHYEALAHGGAAI